MTAHTAPARHEMPPIGAAAARAAATAATVPELATARLVLRAPRLADFAAYAAICTGPRAAGLGGPMDRAAAWADFANYVAGWMLHGHGLWTLCTPGDRATALGFVLVGLEPGDAEPELGYLLTEAAEGRGYATEAARAARDFAARTLGLPGLVSYVDGANPRSAAVALRLGARRDTAAEAALGDATQVYRHILPQEAPHE